MTLRIDGLLIDALDPVRQTAFWAGLLGWEEVVDGDDDLILVPDDDGWFDLFFVPATEPKVVPNQMHFDLTSTSLEDQQSTVAKALELGARHIDIGQRPEE